MFIKKHKVLSVIIGLILLFAISLGGTIGIANATRAKDVAIPDLVGKTTDEAKQILKDSKLKYVEGSAKTIATRDILSDHNMVMATISVIN